MPSRPGTYRPRTYAHVVRPEKVSAVYPMNAYKNGSLLDGLPAHRHPYLQPWRFGKRETLLMESGANTPHGEWGRRTAAKVAKLLGWLS